ncbi:MAG: hypothetical protein M5U12_03630 [Verrucomicrobia bacterium]|nr:hypothetical protein [Verrucomicrobiota bacterium]
MATGVLGTADTPGNAVDVAAMNNYVAVADSETGVALFNVESGFTPTRVAQVDTPGSARSLALIARPNAQDALRVAVADGPGGLVVIDLGLPANARITQQVRLTANAVAVAALGGVGYVGLANGEVNAVDLNSGVILERLRLPNNPNIQDVAISRNTLFVLGVGRLFALPLDEGELRVSSSVDSPGGIGAGQRRLRLFVADGLAYASHTAGFNVLDVSDRENLRSLRVNNTSSFGWKQMVPNGSGLGIACVSPNSTDDGPHHVSLYNLGNDGLGSTFLTTLQTPGLATAAALYNGLAYIADGRAGLQVLNYLAYDAGNQPPTIRLAADFPSTRPRPRKASSSPSLPASATTFRWPALSSMWTATASPSTETTPSSPCSSPPLLGPNRTSFRLRARAFDTGGNFAWSTEYNVNLVPDATAPGSSGASRRPAPSSDRPTRSRRISASPLTQPP